MPAAILHSNPFQSPRHPLLEMFVTGRDVFSPTRRATLASTLIFPRLWPALPDEVGENSQQEDFGR